MTIIDLTFAALALYLAGAAVWFFREAKNTPPGQRFAEILWGTLSALTAVAMVGVIATAS